MITQWSLSRYKDYRRCPAFAHYKHVLKLKEPGNEAMSRGLQIHKMAEYAVAPKAVIPPELKYHEKLFKQVQKGQAIVEEKWAFTDKWKPTQYFAKDVWVRVVCDLVYPQSEGVITVVDHKTGKKYDDHVEDISLYALGGFVQFPDATEVRTQFWYLDQPTDNVVEKVFKLEDVPAIKKEWKAKTKPMLNDKTFAPRANHSCRWCHFSSGKGGPCQF